MAAGQIIDEDSELALKHALAARRMASRIAVVREAVGLAAYAAGDWTTAIAELRTYHRMSGKQTHLAELADCERALGRPERAIDLYRGADVASLDKAGAIELLIVAAGARGDLGQHDAAVAMLQIKELTVDEDAEWAARLRYAYADALLAAGRRDEAREWFARTSALDDEQLTDAAERALELDGVTIEGDDEEEDELDEDAAADSADNDEDLDEDELDEDEEDELDEQDDRDNPDRDDDERAEPADGDHESDAADDSERHNGEADGEHEDENVDGAELTVDANAEAAGGPAGTASTSADKSEVASDDKAAPANNSKAAPVNNGKAEADGKSAGEAAGSEQL